MTSGSSSAVQPISQRTSDSKLEDFQSTMQRQVLAVALLTACLFRANAAESDSSLHPLHKSHARGQGRRFRPSSRDASVPVVATRAAVDDQAPASPPPAITQPSALIAARAAGDDEASAMVLSLQSELAETQQSHVATLRLLQLHNRCNIGRVSCRRG